MVDAVSEAVIGGGDDVPVAAAVATPDDSIPSPPDADGSEVTA